MTSNPKASLEIPRSKDDANSPVERRTTSSTFSSSTKTYSIGSDETGESSRAGSRRASVATLDGIDDNGNENNPKTSTPGKDARRSHRSRNSGGFLLSGSPFEPHHKKLTPSPKHTPEQRRSPRDNKGKTVAQPHEKRGKKKRADTGLGLGIGRSPLAVNVSTSATGNDIEGVAGADEPPKVDAPIETKSPPKPLDVDSAQIVNLALNLSESRRNAARRNISSPVPSLATSFGESFAGGSLRQHLQQQRRVSRNISPKPQRASTVSPRGAAGQTRSPLNATFDSHQDSIYQYHFTPSTLARAEKARTQIELMAQYRRLLQYVPPLKPQGLERPTTASSTMTESPITPAPSTSRSSSNTAPMQLGRQYNPLQYIRNRKVRARERKAIDGEAQGFGDLAKVSSWVDKISEQASSGDFKGTDCMSMPVFSKAAEIAASPHTSPQVVIGKSPASTPKVKRPRIDWDFNPADMLADVFWLEQDDNKKVVEDRSGRKIFPQTTELKRPVSRMAEEPEIKGTPEADKQRSPELRIDTRLPEFRSMKSEAGGQSDSATSKKRHKIRDATRIHHGHNGSVREGHHFLKPRSHSASESSDTDAARHSRRRRSGTADSHDRGRDILEKQMMEMLEKEALGDQWSIPRDMEGQKVIESVESEKPTLKEDLAKSRNSSDAHSRNGSIIAVKGNRSKRNSILSSGRASLEVPGGNPRISLEGLDSTAPNSPQTRATKVANAFVPSIGMDLSPPPPQRPSSPTRNPLLRVKSRINPFEHSRTRSRGRAGTIEKSVSAIVGPPEQVQYPPGTPEKRPRSTSPAKKVPSKRTGDSSTSSLKSSVRKGKANEETSGIRALFKGSRGPVARVSDFLWKKESPSMGTSSGFSTDDSDIEDTRGNKDSRDSSMTRADELSLASPTKEKLSYLGEMPSFTSPSERRGRPSRTRSDETDAGTNSLDQRLAREERRRVSRVNLLGAPPRIDVQNASPSSSPGPNRAVSSHRDSSISDPESRRSSFGVLSADARLNAVLGLPGRRRSALPVTGLSALEATHGARPSLDGNRQWSISDRGVSAHRGPMTKREIARVRALLLSSGIKAKEISRRAAEPKDLNSPDESVYADVAQLALERAKPVPKSKEHVLAARILSDDIQLSKELWQASADTFCNTTIQDLVDKMENLQTRIVGNLTPMARKAADEADEVSKDLVTSQTLKVKRITDTMDKMLRRRRRRFRWLRRGGWLMVEWALVGIMWLVWFLVVFIRVVMGVGRGVVGATRWLLWL